MVFGFPSVRLRLRCKKVRNESLVRLSPLPLPCSVRWCAQIAPAVFKLASLSLPRTTLMVPCAIIVPASAHHRIPAHFRLILRRGRRPRRPVFCSPIAGCTRVLHVCLRRPYFFQQRKKYGKERRQKPTVFGFPFSDCDCGTKRFHSESPALLSPLPLPRPVRWCAAPFLCSGGCRPVPEGTEHSLSAAGRNGAAGGSDPSASGRTA